MECTEIHLNKLVKSIISIFCYWVRTEHEEFILWYLTAILLVLGTHGRLTLSVYMILSLFFTVFRYFLPTLRPEPKSLNLILSACLKELYNINFKQCRNGKIDLFCQICSIISLGKKKNDAPFLNSKPNFKMKL